MDGEGEEMVTDDAKNGRSPLFHSSLLSTGRVGLSQTRGTAEDPNVRARWVAHEFKWVDGPDKYLYAPAPWLDLVKSVLCHVTASGNRNVSTSSRAATHALRTVGS